MRLIGLPTEEPSPEERVWIEELEEMLNGSASGPEADAWRSLRTDVRALAPAIEPAFEADLRAELESRGALPRGALAPAAPLQGAERSSKRGARAQGGRVLAELRRRSAALRAHPGVTAGAALTATAALVAVLILTGPGAGGSGGGSVASDAVTSAGRASHTDAERSSQSAPVPESRTGAPATALRAAPSTAGTAPPAAPAAASPAAPAASPAAPGRVQQLGASVTLRTTPGAVQAVSDQLGQLAVRLGGYVQSSNVQIQSPGASEATFALRLPSARFQAALAAIGRLASVGAESQSLQDITNSYNSAHQQLTDAVAERGALLRALAGATTEGQIDSLRERLAQARAAILRDQAAFSAVAQRAASTEVEVVIVGDAKARSEGLTVHRGLHDAGRVLTVTLIVLLILAAVLAPLALLGVSALAGRRALRRYRRERVLDGP